MHHLALALEDRATTIGQELSRFALDVSSCGVVIVSATEPDWPIVYTNAAFNSMTGYARHEVLGRNCRFMQGADRDQPQLAAIRSAMHRQQPITTELRNYRKDGTLFWCGLSITPFKDRSGRVTHFIGMQSDITARKESEAALVFQSTHDMQTGLPNALMLHRYLSLNLRDPAPATGLGVATLKIDRFLSLLSSLDAASVDLLLQTIATRLNECSSEGEFVARHEAGGFSMVFHGVDHAAAAQRGRCIHAAVGRPIVLQAHTVHLTCSIGVALFPEHANNATALVKYADMALSRARELGRNSEQFYADDMTQRMRERVVMEAALRMAIANGELHLHYQPLVDLRSGAIAGCEALARWTHPVLGRVGPDQFIPIAEDTGLIDDIGQWVLEQTCRDLVERRVLGLPPLPVAVNVSPVQFRDPALADRIAALLSAHQLGPEMLVLEVTEAVLMEDTATSQATLARLHAMAIGLALDDFGTGYSSLNYLRRFPFQKVKIDRSFITHVTENADDAAIVRSIISMSHTLGISVVAEGVETEAQCAFLGAAACDEIQGYLFSRPLAGAAFNAFLQSAACLPATLRRMPSQDDASPPRSPQPSSARSR